MKRKKWGNTLFDIIEKVCFVNFPAWIVLPCAVAVIILSINIFNHNTRPSVKMGIAEVNEEIEDLELTIYGHLEMIEGGTNEIYAPILARQAELSMTESELKEQREAIVERAQYYDKEYKKIIDPSDKSKYGHILKELDSIKYKNSNLNNKRREIARSRMAEVPDPVIKSLYQNYKGLQAHKDHLLSFDKEWRERGGHIIELLIVVLMASSILTFIMRALFMLS